MPTIERGEISTLEIGEISTLASGGDLYRRPRQRSLRHRAGSEWLEGELASAATRTCGVQGTKKRAVRTPRFHVMRSPAIAFEPKAKCNCNGQLLRFCSVAGAREGLCSVAGREGGPCWEQLSPLNQYNKPSTL